MGKRLIIMLIDRAIQQWNVNPQQLFMIDALGTLLSAFLLGVVLVKLENIFGIPRSVLYLLALLPCLFAVYDLYCYQGSIKNIGVRLKGIAVMNGLYCILSLGLAIHHHRRLTYFGWAYYCGRGRLSDDTCLCGMPRCSPFSRSWEMTA